MLAKILVGLPSSGKSTWVKENRKDELVVNCDSIRMMLTNKADRYEAFDVCNEKIVWSTFIDIIHNIAMDKKDIIIDNTNCNLGNLKELVDLLVKIGYNIEYKVIDTDIGIIKERLESYPDLIPVVERISIGLEKVKEWLHQKEGKNALD